MSGKLDQSLDEILSTQRRSAVRGKGGRRVRRGNQAGRTAPAAPVGGVKKNPKQAKGAVKAIPTGPSGGSGESRIQVSNLVSVLSRSSSSNVFLTLCSAQGCERSPDQGMLPMRLSKPIGLSSKSSINAEYMIRRRNREPSLCDVHYPCTLGSLITTVSSLHFLLTVNLEALVDRSWARYRLAQTYDSLR